MSAGFDTLVVGGGVLGAAIAHALQATPGLGRVALLERETLASGATGRSGGMIRAFHADAALTDLATASLPAWRALAPRIGFVRTGAMYVAPASRRGAVAATAARIRAAGGEVALLGAAEARARFPGVVFADHELVAFEPEAGYADATAATRAFAVDAVRAGAFVVTHAPVEALRVEGGRVVGVRAGGQELRASRVVLAAGLGTAGLLAAHGVDLGLHAKAIQITPLAGAPAEHPCFLDLAPRAFGRPAGPAASWVGVASEDGVVGAPVAADARRAIALATARFPALAGRVAGESVRTADAYTRGAPGLLGPVPGIEGLILAAGFGGTGFKIAPAVAARVAALLAPVPQEIA